MEHDCGLDLLAVEAFTWTPTLETACEIGLRYAEAGQRVGFAFLDIENVDQFPLVADIDTASWMYRAGRRSRIKRVRSIEDILRSRGVTVIPDCRYPDSGARFSCAELGVDSLTSLQNLRLEGASLGFGIMSSLVRHFGDSAPDFATSRAVADRLVNSACRAFLLTRDLIERWRPAEVLVYNGRFAVSKGISEAARLCGVKLRYHEIVSTCDRFYSAPHAVHNQREARRELRNAWASAGEEREAVARRYFAPARGGTTLFENQFLEHQQRDVSVPRGHRRRIAFFTSSIDEYAAIEEGFESPLFDSQHEAAAWLASWVRVRPDAELLIRIHPRARWLSARERRWWESLEGPNVVVLPAESPVDSYRLADSADLVVTHHSSIGAEAAHAGSVSILVGDAEYRGLDCVYEPQTLDELAELLGSADVSPKPRDNSLPFGYQRLMRGEVYRFYQPLSFHEGGFFGRRVVPDREKPLPERTAVKVLHLLQRVRRFLATRRSGRFGSTGASPL